MLFFFFNDTATTEIYTLSLHDALPIFAVAAAVLAVVILLAPLLFWLAWNVLDFAHAVGLPELGFWGIVLATLFLVVGWLGDRKSTRLNSSHSQISYAVFCLKKKYTTSHSQLSPPVAAATRLCWAFRRSHQAEPTSLQDQQVSTRRQS